MSRHRSAETIENLIAGLLTDSIDTSTREVRTAGKTIMRTIASLTIKELKEIKQNYIPPISEVEYDGDEALDIGLLKGKTLELSDAKKG